MKDNTVTSALGRKTEELTLLLVKALCPLHCEQYADGLVIPEKIWTESIQHLSTGLCEIQTSFIIIKDEPWLKLMLSLELLANEKMKPLW